MIDTIKGIVDMVNRDKNIRDKANLLYMKEDFTYFTKEELVYIANVFSREMHAENKRKKELIKEWSAELDECRKLVENENEK